MPSLIILELKIVMQVAVLVLMITRPGDKERLLLAHCPAIYLVSFKDLGNNKSSGLFFS